MRVRLLPAIAVLCVVPGCADDGTCTSAVADYAAGASGEGKTAQIAFESALAGPMVPGLPSTGWSTPAEDGSVVTYQSGASKVEVRKLDDGTWVVDQATACH